MTSDKRSDGEFTLRNTGEGLGDDHAVRLFKEQAPQVQDLVKERRPIEWLVEGVLPRCAMYAFHGDPKVGAKSLIALHLCLCIVADHPFAGRSVSPGSIVYCNFEDGRWLCAQRLWQLGIRPDLRPSTEHRAFVITETDAIGPTLRVIRMVRPAVVVFDTFAHLCLAHGVRDENDPEQVTKLVAFYSRLCHETGTTIIFIHHNRKDDFVMRGSTALIASLDGWWSIEPGEDEAKLITTTSKSVPAAAFALQIGFPEDLTDGEVTVQSIDREEFVPLVQLGKGRGRSRARGHGGNGQGPKAKVSDEELYMSLYRACAAEPSRFFGYNVLAGAVGGVSNRRVKAYLEQLVKSGEVCKGPNDRGYRWVDGK